MQRASDECSVADGQYIKVKKGVRVTLSYVVDGTMHVITLSEIWYAKDLTHKLLLYSKFEKKQVDLINEDGRRYLTRISDGARVLEAEK